MTVLIFSIAIIKSLYALVQHDSFQALATIKYLAAYFL